MSDAEILRGFEDAASAGADINGYQTDIYRRLVPCSGLAAEYWEAPYVDASICRLLVEPDTLNSWITRLTLRNHNLVDIIQRAMETHPSMKVQIELRFMRVGQSIFSNEMQDLVAEFFSTDMESYPWVLMEVLKLSSTYSNLEPTQIATDFISELVSRSTEARVLDWIAPELESRNLGPLMATPNAILATRRKLLIELSALLIDPSTKRRRSGLHTPSMLIELVSEIEDALTNILGGMRTSASLRQLYWLEPLVFFYIILLPSTEGGVNSCNRLQRLKPVVEVFESQPLLQMGISRWDTPRKVEQFWQEFGKPFLVAECPGSFGSLEERMRYFSELLLENPETENIEIRIRRSHVLEDSYAAVASIPRGVIPRFVVSLIDTEGEDDSGLSTWVTLVTQELFGSADHPYDPSRGDDPRRHYLAGVVLGTSLRHRIPILVNVDRILYVAVMAWDIDADTLWYLNRAQRDTIVEVGVIVRSGAASVLPGAGFEKLFSPGELAELVQNFEGRLALPLYRDDVLHQVLLKDRSPERTLTILMELKNRWAANPLPLKNGAVNNRMKLQVMPAILRILGRVADGESFLTGLLTDLLAWDCRELGYPQEIDTIQLVLDEMIIQRGITAMALGRALLH